MNWGFGHSGVWQEDVDFLVAESYLQIGFERKGGQEIVVNWLWNANEKVDVAAACLIICARTE